MSYLPDNLYKKILNNVPIFCVDVYIYSKKTKNFLLVKRNNEPEKNKYCCPGGRVLKGEDLLNAALRKVREELKINIKKNKLYFIGVTNTFFKNSVYKNVSSHTINASFIYEVNNVDNFNIKLSSESSNFEWKNGKEKNVVKFVKSTIDKIKAIKFKTSAIYLNFEQI